MLRRDRPTLGRRQNKMKGDRLGREFLREQSPGEEYRERKGAGDPQILSEEVWSVLGWGWVSWFFFFF